MKFLLLILLLGVCLPHWTTGKRGYHHRRRHSRIKQGKLMKAEPVNATHIDLSNSGIHSISVTAFNNLEAIKSLDLSSNDIWSLEPAIFSELRNLEKLILRNNHLSFFDHVFLGLNNLTHVDISLNRFGHLTSSYVSGLPESTIIYVGEYNHSLQKEDPFEYEKSRLRHFQSNSYNNNGFNYNGFNNYHAKTHMNIAIKICKTVDGLVESVEELKGNDTLGDCIEKEVINGLLELSDLHLRKFERNWYKLQAHDIEKLKLYRNEITDITPELLNDLPSSLSDIDLSSNNITIIKKNITENRYIKTMRLDYNLISTVEDGAFENMNSTTLYIQGNQLNDLAFIKTLPATLTGLYLGQNVFPVISANTFEGLKKLETLDLSDCRIETIEPRAFEDLENLYIVLIMFNRISELKPGTFMGLTNLQALQLSWNRIVKISRGIFSRDEVPNLRAIRLDHNQIETIEAQSLSLPNLLKIDLGINKITEKSLSSNAFEGSSLIWLGLGDNLISEINESFPHISSLQALSLDGNRIMSIKKGAFKNSLQLMILNLSRNPLNRLENGVFYGLSNLGDKNRN